MNSNSEKCSKCDGTGFDFKRPEITKYDRLFTYNCRTCNGTGRTGGNSSNGMEDPFMYLLPYGIIGYYLWDLAQLLNLHDIVMYLMFAAAGYFVIKKRKYIGWIAYACVILFAVEKAYSDGLIFNKAINKPLAPEIQNNNSFIPAF